MVYKLCLKKTQPNKQTNKVESWLNLVVWRHKEKRQDNTWEQTLDAERVISSPSTCSVTNFLSCLRQALPTHFSKNKDI